MHSVNLFLWSLIPLAVGLLVGFFFARWLVGRSVAKSLGSLAPAVREMSSNYAELLAKYEVEKGRAASYLRVLQGFEDERNHWKGLYFQESSMHGNAQQMLIAEVTSLTAQYRTAMKREPLLNPVVLRVTGDYACAHPTPNPPAPAPGLPADDGPTQPDTSPPVMGST